VAGAIKLAKAGYFKGHQNQRLVCTVTGHGLKDPKTAMQNLPQPVVVQANQQAILKLIGL
jgi:threonine synthase